MFLKLYSWWTGLTRRWVPVPVVLQGDANLSRAQKEALQIIFGIWLVQKNNGKSFTTYDEFYDVLSALDVYQRQ